jgi:AraC-like DNA-binding protein
VEFYAQRQSITTRHLSAVVKDITGKSASQIIALIVMNEAKVLLNSSNKPVSEISGILGLVISILFLTFLKNIWAKVLPSTEISSKTKILHLNIFFQFLNICLSLLLP